MVSWLYTGSQGLVCSPIKTVRELGLERCEPVWLLSTGSVDYLKGRVTEYERNGDSAPLVYRLSDKALPSSYALRDKG